VCVCPAHSCEGLSQQPQHVSLIVIH